SYIVTLTVTDNSGGVGTTSVIVVIGTPDPDLITIDPAGAGQVTITSDGTSFGPFNASMVMVFGKERDDTIRGRADLSIPLELHGGSGNDTLVGAQGNDTIFGGPGADSIVGGPGDDVLKGEHGNDTYVGGLGNDTYIVIPGSDSVLNESGDSVGI